jgi:hypothetical protein
MSSKRKREANRRNASKSTGPRTPEGKARVSRNAVTSGLCSRKVLLPDETLDTVRAQLNALRRELKPPGAGEESLVALMARDLRKLARHDRLEAGVFKWHRFGPSGRSRRSSLGFCPVSPKRSQRCLASPDPTPTRCWGEVGRVQP